MGAEGDCGAAPGSAILEQQLVAAHRRDLGRGVGDQVIDRVGIGPAPERVRIGPEADPPGAGIDGDAAAMVQLAFAQDEAAEDQEAAGRAFDRDAPLHRGRVAGGDGADGHGAPVQPVDPDAVAQPHLEGRGHRQKLPARAGLDQHPEPAGAGDVVGVAGRPEQPVERGVADGQERGEDPVHPAGGAQRRLVQQHPLAAAQDMAVAPRQRGFLRGQHHMAVLRPVGDEEGQRRGAVGLDLPAVGIAPVDLVRVQLQGDRRGGVLHQAADRGAGRGDGGIPVGGGSLDPGQKVQIGLARGGRVVGDMEAEEGQARPRAGVQPQRPGLDRGAGDLVLQPCAGQVTGLDPPGRPEPRPHHLQRIRGEGRRAVEAALRHPGVAGGLRQVLPAHHHRAEAVVPGDMVVDVLRDIGFVVHHEAAVAQPQILDQHRIAVDRRRAGVGQLNPPQPDRPVGVQPERHPMADPQRHAFPDEAVGAGGDRDPGGGSDHLGRGGIGGAAAQDQPANAAFQRGALDLRDQRAAAAMVVADGEQAAVGQQIDAQPRAVGDAAQAEIPRQGCAEAAKRRHSSSPVSGRLPGAGPVLDRSPAFCRRNLGCRAGGANRTAPGCGASQSGAAGPAGGVTKRGRWRRVSAAARERPKVVASRSAGLVASQAERSFAS